MYSAYDFNQSIAHRAEYVEERLKGGAPVVGISYDRGVLLFTVKRTQRKVFEIYDQLMYSAIGNQADVEAVRLAAIDFAHQEGFQRSPDDVSIQRLVGFAISPAIKRSFGDPMAAPHVLRAIFGEVGKTPEQDLFFVLNYDGEFSNHTRAAAVGGNPTGEEAMQQEVQRLAEEGAGAEGTAVPDLAAALQLAAEIWRKGAAAQLTDGDGEDEATPANPEHSDPLEDALKHGAIEAAVLERDTPRESKFRMLREDEVAAVVPSAQ
jgi:proteasome alpha subunit